MFTEFVHRQNVHHLKRQLAAAQDDTARKMIQKLLEEEIERGERYRDARFRSGDDHPGR